MTAVITATGITRTAFYKDTSSDRSTDLCVLLDAFPGVIWRLRGFLCVRDAGRKANKFTGDISLLMISDLQIFLFTHHTNRVSTGFLIILVNNTVTLRQAYGAAVFV